MFISEIFEWILKLVNVIIKKHGYTLIIYLINQGGPIMSKSTNAVTFNGTAAQ